MLGIPSNAAANVRPRHGTEYGRSPRMNSVADDSNASDSVMFDLTSMPLRDLLFDGETPLDRAVRAVVADLDQQVYRAFGNTPGPAPAD
jgi:hypothetical protein